MKIFLDTADIEEIKRAKKIGIIDGVTTNPTLMKKAGVKNIKQTIKDICNIVKGPVSVEAISTNTEEIMKEAEMLAAYSKNIAVKIPVTEYGLEAVKGLSVKGIKTNVTLVFSTNQALLAAKAGADYVSPFVGRLDDIGQNGMGLVKDILKVYKNYHFKTEVIAASIRNANHVAEAAKIKAHIVTVPYKILEEMFKHELTDKGIEKFLEDYKATNG